MLCSHSRLQDVMLQKADFIVWSFASESFYDGSTGKVN